MDNEKLDRIVLLLENMNNDISDLKQGQQEMKQELKQDIAVLKQQNASIAEAINTTNQNLISKIDMMDKKIDVLEGRTNINTIDINRLRAAK